MISKVCYKCYSKLFHYEIHDSQCCIVCNTWSDSKCDEANECGYCNNRPEVPFTERENKFIRDVITAHGMKEASTSLGIGSSMISRVCTRKRKKTHGYIFMFLEDYKNILAKRQN